MAKSTAPAILLLAALADPTRLEILRQLAGSAEVCACDFTDCCDVSQPTISHHLKVLRDAGVVTSERRADRGVFWIAAHPPQPPRGNAPAPGPRGGAPAAALARGAAGSPPGASAGAGG